MLLKVPTCVKPEIKIALGEQMKRNLIQKTNE